MPSKLRIRKFFIPLLSTPIFYILVNLFVRGVFSVGRLGPNLLLDLFLQIILGYILFLFSRKTYLFLAEQVTLMAIIYVGHALKIIFLGSPVTIDDFYSFSALYHILDKKIAIFLVIPFVLFLGAFLVNLKIRRKPALVSICVILVISLAITLCPNIIANSFESVFKYRNWNQLHNYESGGGTVYLFYRASRFVMDRLKPPSQEEVKSALKRLSTRVEYPEYSEKFKPRNVFFIVMESLWDPILLDSVEFSQDPFDPEFRSLWTKGGNSWVMSPAFGGTTANPEFEILTGHPANLHGNKVMFQTSIKNKIPALPKILSSNGYEAIAFHPNLASFWNRLNAYNRLGFDAYYSSMDFDLTDLNGLVLSDISLYRQSVDILKKQHSNKKPKFVYILTITGHFPFLLNQQRRPIFIKSNSSFAPINQYANSIFYSTRETMSLIRGILKSDPDALIIVTGDHLPLLGTNFEAFVQADLLADSTDKFTAKMHRIFSSIPIIIIDGKRGPVDIGTVAMYEIPGIVLNLLKLPESGMVDVFKPKDNLHVRTLEGMNLVIDNTDRAQLCKSASENQICEYVFNWLKDIKVLDRDILVGRQFSLETADRLLPDELIAHAAGAVDSISYSNSKEALDESYAKGFRFIEVDLEWTTDGYLVLLHDWGRTVKLLFEAEARKYSLDGFKDLKMNNGLTQLTLDDLADWLRAHPDVFIVTDVKRDNLKGLTVVKERFPELVDRFIPQIYYFQEYSKARNMGYKHIILTLYVAGYSDYKVLKFIDNNKLAAVTMPINRAFTNLPAKLQQKGIPSYTHTINDPKIFKALKDNGVFGVYTDVLEP